MPLEAAKLQHTALPSEPTKHVNGRMWSPGQSGIQSAFGLAEDHVQGKGIIRAGSNEL